MSKIIIRLIEVVKEKANGKHTIFARNAGILPTTFQNYLKGRMPNAESLINICETYNVNINWLLAGKGEKYISQPEADEGVAEDTPIYNDIETKDKLIQTQDELISQMKKRITEMEEKIKINEECKNKIREEDEEIQRGKILKQRAM